MDSLNIGELTGLPALLYCTGHVIYLIYKYWQRQRLAKIDEESEVISAQADYLKCIAESAAKMIETAEKRVNYLSEQLGQLQVEYTVLRQKLMETQDIVGALKSENRRLQERVIELERENARLKERIRAIEQTNGYSGDQPAASGSPE